MLRGGHPGRTFRFRLDLAPRGDSLERRTIHPNRDCTFTVDGRTINLQERMVICKQFQD